MSLSQHHTVGSCRAGKDRKKWTYSRMAGGLTRGECSTKSVSYLKGIQSYLSLYTPKHPSTELLHSKRSSRMELGVVADKAGILASG